AGIRDLRRPPRQRPERRVLFVALLERAVTRVFHHLEGAREREHNAAAVVAGDANAVAAQLTDDPVFEVEPPRRTVVGGSSNHRGTGFDAELRIRAPEVAAERLVATYAEDALPRGVDVSHAPIRTDDDNGIAKRVHG